MLNHPLTEGQRPSPSLPTHVRYIFISMIGPIMVVSRWIQLRSQREQLAELENHQLADLV